MAGTAPGSTRGTSQEEGCMYRQFVLGITVAVCLRFSQSAQAQSAERSYDQGARAYRAQNMEEARDHFRRASYLGHGRACYNYGVMSYQGLAFGEPNMEQAWWDYARAC